MPAYSTFVLPTCKQIVWFESQNVRNTNWLGKFTTRHFITILVGWFGIFRMFFETRSTGGHLDGSKWQTRRSSWEGSGHLLAVRCSSEVRHAMSHWTVTRGGVSKGTNESKREGRDITSEQHQEKGSATPFESVTGLFQDYNRGLTLLWRDMSSSLLSQYFF